MVIVLDGTKSRGNIHCISIIIMAFPKTTPTLHFSRCNCLYDTFVNTVGLHGFIKSKDLVGTEYFKFNLPDLG